MFRYLLSFFKRKPRRQPEESPDIWGQPGCTCPNPPHRAGCPQPVTPARPTTLQGAVPQKTKRSAATPTPPRYERPTWIRAQESEQSWMMFHQEPTYEPEPTVTHTHDHGNHHHHCEVDAGHHYVDTSPCYDSGSYDSGSSCSSFD